MCAKSVQSCPTLATLGTVALQTPLSVGFSRQDYWSGLPCPPPGDLPNPGLEPRSPMAPVLRAGFLLLSPQGSPEICIAYCILFWTFFKLFILKTLSSWRFEEKQYSHTPYIGSPVNIVLHMLYLSVSWHIAFYFELSLNFLFWKLYLHEDSKKSKTHILLMCSPVNFVLHMLYLSVSWHTQTYFPPLLSSCFPLLSFLFWWAIRVNVRYCDTSYLNTTNIMIFYS